MERRYALGKTLVAYFSCSSVTEELAKALASVVEGDLFRIEPTVPYTDDDLNWNDRNSRSTIEMQDRKSRPEIANTIQNIDGYDIVFVGFPIWWYVAPTIINTFLESYDFSGKTVIPFATSGTSGVGDTDKHLHTSCSKSTKWRPAMRFGQPFNKGEIAVWVDSLNL